MELTAEIVYVNLFFIKRSILSVCQGYEGVSEYYPYCESWKCSSSYENTNEIVD